MITLGYSLIYLLKYLAAFRLFIYPTIFSLNLIIGLSNVFSHSILLMRRGLNAITLKLGKYIYGCQFL